MHVVYAFVRYLTELLVSDDRTGKDQEGNDLGLIEVIPTFAWWE
jgi:hypothetical protein